MREPTNIEQLVTLGPDYIGLIFYAPSKRFVENLDPEMLNQIPPQIKKTGVFVNEALDEIRQKIKSYDLNAVQLHGSESPELCKLLKDTGIEVIKAFGVDEDFDFGILKTYENSVDFFLFDTKTKLHGGSGLTFNWDLLKGYELNVPYFLSGGLNADNIFEALKLRDKRFYAIDLNSRFEASPGLKDIAKLKSVFNQIKHIPA